MSKELRQLFEDLRNAQDKANTIMNKSDTKIEEIQASTNEIKTIKAKIEAQKALDEGLTFDENGIEITNEPTPQSTKVKENNDDKAFNTLHVKAFAKAIAKKPLNGEEIKALSSNTDSDGGYLIPKDILTQINLLSREYVSLRDLVTVVPVKTKEGNRILEVDAARTPFGDIAELTDIPNINSPKWAQLSYKIRDLGGLLPIPNSLLADETGGLTTYLATWFVQKAYATDNQMILFDDGSKGSQGIIGTSKLAADIKTADNVFTKEVLVAPLTFEHMKSIINKGFPRPIAASLKIVTNQSGLDILDNMEDKQGRPYLTGSGTEDFPYMFKGRAVVVYDDETLPNDVTTPASPLVPFIVGDLKKGVVLWDRQQMSVASSTEAGFVNNSTLMRGIIRQDTRIWDRKAVKIIYSPLTAGA
jgi:HK97 family phage major capsid protein